MLEDRINKLRVGTITALYNNEQYIKECLGGLFNQSRKPNIITVIDDCSNDNSWMVFKQSIKDIPGSKIVEDEECSFKAEFLNISIAGFKNQNNLGPAGARNVGLKYLLDKVDIIGVADSDDIYYETKIEKTLNVFLKYPQVALIYSDYDTEDTKNNKITREFKECYSFRRLFDECIVSNNSFYATKVIQLIGLYDENLRGPEDYDLWLRIAEVGAVYHIPEALYKYRLHGNNITIATASNKFAEQVRYVKEKALKRIGGHSEQK